MTGHTRRILYLEDEQDLINMIRLVLGRQGYEVIGANTVARAIEILDGQDVDLVFVDLNLGQDSGWDFINHLAEKNNHPHLPKVIVSAQTLDVRSRAETGYGTNYDEIVNKPFPITTLVDVTKRLLNRSCSLH